MFGKSREKTVGKIFKHNFKLPKRKSISEMQLKNRVMREDALALLSGKDTEKVQKTQEKLIFMMKRGEKTKFP